MRVSINLIKSFTGVVGKNCKSVLQTTPPINNFGTKGLKLSTDCFEKSVKKNFSDAEISGAIKSYTQTNGINEAIRSGNFEVVKNTVETLDYGLKNAKPLGQKVVGYRGIQVPKESSTEEYVEKYLNKNKAYTSVAKDKYIANYFKDNGRNNGVLIEVSLPPETHALQTNYEYILARNSKFNIEKVNDSLYRAFYMP